MHRITLLLSDDEYEVLRRLSFERRLSLAKLIRDAVDRAYATEHEEIQRPGRQPKE